MIIIKGKYPDQSIKTCNSKDPITICQWFEREFKPDFEDEDYKLDFDEIRFQIMKNDPNLEYIESYLNDFDHTIEKWD